MKQTLDEWVFVGIGGLPERYPHEVWPGVETTPGGATVDIGHHFELPYGERLILDVLVRFRRPRVIFEFGTYTGTTTKLLADAEPDAEIHTIDLPGSGGVIGRAFADEPGRIVQHRVNIADFDFTPFHRRCDLVFIDASHDRDDVVRDSRIAFDLLSRDGTLVWDDYQAAQPGVVEALAIVAREREVLNLRGTRLAVHQRPHLAQ